MSDTITPSGLHGIRIETSLRLFAMLESLINEIVDPPNCKEVTAQFITDQITYGLHSELGWGTKIQIYAERAIKTREANNAANPT